MIISVIAWASAAISSQQPSWASMRPAAAAIAEARLSRCQAPGGAASTTATLRFGRGSADRDRRGESDIAGAGHQDVETAIPVRRKIRLQPRSQPSSLSSQPP